MNAVSKRLSVFVCVLALGVGLRAADPAFIGKWKFNQAKSSMTGDTVTIGPAANGMMQFNSQGFSYTFKLDGKDYPTPDGGVTAWKETSPTVWDVTNHMAGRVSATYRLVLNTHTLSVLGKTMKPDGGSMDFAAAVRGIATRPNRYRRSCCHTARGGVARQLDSCCARGASRTRGRVTGGLTSRAECWAG